ncbi:hypothetical protein BDW59DRAFT_179154 [Aspergillus cavernicola]|uniref:Uncharacterized protein n=1 Tax=Aspergillus cavernicola TaxID=176166 RepID=A0ABR4II04_9EURO
MRNQAILAVLFSIPVAAQSDPDVLCVYPLSGVYTPLQRILFYVLMVFGVLGRRQRWLVAGALASAMTYCGAAAIHSFILIAKARSSSVDLDIYAVFAVTSTSIMLAAPLLAWSTTLQTAEREVRMIILLWTLLTAVGAVLATAAIYIRGGVESPTCFTSFEDISSAASTLQAASGNCTYVCFSEERPLFRSPSDILAWKNQLDIPSQITSVFVPTVAASIPCSIITWVWIIRKGRTYLLRPPPVFTRLELGWVGEWLFGRGRRGPISPPEITHYPEAVRYPRLLLAYRSYFVVGSFGAFGVNIVMNEIRLRTLPTNEMPFEVGQWSPWVGVALVLLGQLVSQLSKKTETPKSDREYEDEEELRIWGGEGQCKQMNVRTSTLLSRSEGSTFRRRNSF